MTSLTLCSKLSDQSVRIGIEGVNFSAQVGELKAKCAKKIDQNPDEFDLFYAGVCLKEEQLLESYGVKSGVTVYAMKALKSATPPTEPEPMDETSAQQVVTALQAALLNPAYRNIVEKMVTDEETMENLMVAIPELDKDAVAMTMLQELELLAMLADPKLIRKVIEAHPCLGQAALYIAAAVNEEGAKLGSSNTGGSSGSYSLDRMSDEEDEDGPPRLRHLPRSEQGEITATQLAAALAAASGSQPSTSQSSANEGVSLDFFQQAMAQAQSQGSSQASSSSSPSANLEMQLQQMRDMGITDESVARTALAATGGNVQAALEIIFGDGSME